MINEFIQAIAKKLKTLYPDKKIFVDEVPDESEDSFFIDVINVDFKQGLNTIKQREITFDIAFCSENSKNFDFYDWVEKIADEFETIEVSDLYRTKDYRTSYNAGIYHFIFTVVYRTIQKTDKTMMSELNIKQGTKYD